jgi:GTP:adenosylcobinamide-phosphate guanylyltransferase
MDAIILAGAPNSGPLREISPAQYEAEIPIAGKPMLDYVMAALQHVPAIERIVVVGAAALSPELRGEPVTVTSPGQSLVDSLTNGLNVIPGDQPVLVATSDIPLLTREAVEDFLERCRKLDADIYYSCVPKELNEAKYPGVRRTYVKLAEGTFTGGNLALIRPRAVRQSQGLLQKAASLRKKPWQLCKMLGWNYLIKLVAGRLSIPEIEGRVSGMLQLKVVGIVSPYPEVGIDVDKPSDLKLAAKVLSK